MTTGDVAIRQPDDLTLPDEETFRRGMEAINRFQKVVHATMIRDLDYGVIPGTTKPTLLKPGAEKITKLLSLADHYEIVDRQECWETTKPFFRYLIRCSLINIKSGTTISTGLGECNSMESKYRWRKAMRKCPLCSQETIFKSKKDGGWFCWSNKGGCGASFKADDPTIISQVEGKVPNEDIFSSVNTILKMGKKRALVDAALSAGRLSDVFTQDMEDMKDETPPEPEKPAPAVSPAATNEGNKPPDGKERARDGIVDPNPPDKIDLTTLDFKNPGEFYTAGHKHFGLDKSTVQIEVPEYDLTIAGQRKEAWLKIVAVYGKKE